MKWVGIRRFWHWFSGLRIKTNSFPRPKGMWVLTEAIKKTISLQDRDSKYTRNVHYVIYTELPWKPDIYVTLTYFSIVFRERGQSWVYAYKTIYLFFIYILPQWKYEVDLIN